MTNNHCPYESPDLELVGKLSFRKRKWRSYACCDSNKPKGKAFCSGEMRVRSFEPSVSQVSREEHEKRVSTYWTQIFWDIDLRMIHSL